VTPSTTAPDTRTVAVTRGGGRRARRGCVAALLCAAVIAAATPVGARAPGTPIPPVIDADAYALVDADTGVVLLAQGLHEPRLVASTVKVVTALTALRNLGENGQITVSTQAATREPFRMGMQVGQVWPMRDSLYSLILASANDVAYAMAESSGGTLEGFAQQMTAIGTELGMADSSFADPSGFDDDAAIIGPTLMSVYDLAIAGRAALAHPTLRTVIATPNYEFVDPTGATRTLTNHAKMLRPTSPQFYDGTNGVKTGFTDRAS
jgi:serine-type D-Ala-D-Ala carboxypeptidase (penicillin-binding protein 5/6)